MVKCRIVAAAGIREMMFSWAVNRRFARNRGNNIRYGRMGMVRLLRADMWIEE